MNKKEHSFHKITRPGQYVAFIVLEAQTLEGPAERIDAIIKPSNGKAIFNKGFHQRIAGPLIASLDQRFSRKN